VVNRFIEHSKLVTINNYNTLNIPVSIENKIKSSMSACWPLLGNET
jgi:hypothetical protein